jgi:hypothetical protein
MTTENKIKLHRIPGFIILYGLLCGLVLSFNLWLVNFIGYLAIWTNLIFIFFLFLYFIKTYKWLIGTDVKILTSLVVGIPVFLIALAIFKFFYDFGSTIYYTDHGRKELVMEWFGYAVLMTVLLSFVFLPIYKWKNRNIISHKNIN